MMPNTTPDRHSVLALIARRLSLLVAQLRATLSDDATDPELEKQICAWDADVINRGSAWRKN